MRCSSMRQRRAVFWIVLGFLFNMVIHETAAEAIIIAPTDARGIRRISNDVPVLLDFLTIMTDPRFLPGPLEDRTVMEFDISELEALPSISIARLNVPLDNLDEGGPAGIIDVFTFCGDGSVTADEFFAGTFFTSVTNNEDATASVDVTEAVQTFLAAECRFLGFRLSTTTMDRYGLGSLVGLPIPTLSVNEGTVNALVGFEPTPSTYDFTPDPAGCPEGFVGKFSFAAQLSNISDLALSDLVVAVTALTGGNLLQNADGGPGGVGAQLTVPQQDGFADGVLSLDEFVDVPFIICLTQRRPFTFMVDVLGEGE